MMETGMGRSQCHPCNVLFLLVLVVLLLSQTRPALGRELRLETFGRGTSLAPDESVRRRDACTAAFVSGVERLVRRIEGFALVGETEIKDGLVQCDKVQMTSYGSIASTDPIRKIGVVSSYSNVDGILEKYDSDMAIQDETKVMTVRVVAKMGLIVNIEQIEKIQQSKGEIIDWANPPRNYLGIELTAVSYSQADNICNVSLAYLWTRPDRPGIALAKTSPKVAADRVPPVITLVSPEVKRGVKLVAREAAVTVIGKATDSSGIATVTVNGQQANLDADGNFSAEVLLKVGENKVSIIATDTQRNAATETFTLMRESGHVAKPKQTVPAANPLANGSYLALIIGNNEYQKLDRLQTAVNDAREVDRTLREQYGFQTQLLLNATRNDILTAFNDLRRRVKEDDNVLVYYAGHGEFDRSADKAFWLPVDAQPDNDTEWIIADNITASVKRLSSKHVLIVSDSCYSGTLSRSAQTHLQPGERNELLKKMSQRQSRSIMASGGNEPVADGGGSGHSIFADSFLTALKEIEMPIFAADELFHQHIKPRVAGKSDQLPQYNALRNSGDEGGDFVFTKRRQ